MILQKQNHDAQLVRVWIIPRPVFRANRVKPRAKTTTVKTLRETCSAVPVEPFAHFGVCKLDHSSQQKCAAQRVPKRYLTEHELAERLSLSVQFLRRRHARREPPHYAKFGESVRYPVDAVEAFEASAVQLPPLAQPRRSPRN